MEYRCCISSDTLRLLEELVHAPWGGIEAQIPERQPGNVRTRVDVLRIVGAAPVEIRCAMVDVRWKVEVGVIAAHPPIPPRWPVEERPFVPVERSFEFAKIHRLSILGRSHVFAGEPGEPPSRLLGEDVLVIESSLKGTPLFVACDDEIPGALILCESWDVLPFADTAVEYVRRIV